MDLEEFFESMITELTLTDSTLGGEDKDIDVTYV